MQIDFYFSIINGFPSIKIWLYQIWANYGLWTRCGPLGFPIRPAKLQRTGKIDVNPSVSCTATSWLKFLLMPLDGTIHQMCQIIVNCNQVVHTAPLLMCPHSNRATHTLKTTSLMSLYSWHLFLIKPKDKLFILPRDPWAKQMTNENHPTWKANFQHRRISP